MAVFEIQGPDGKTYEVDAPDMQAAVAAIKKMAATAPGGPAAPSTSNPDGTYGTAPEGFTLNPRTGQMEDLRSPNNPNIPQGRLAAAGVGLGQGLGYNMLDEAVGGISALAGGPQAGAYARDVMRETDRRAQEQFPITTGGTKVAGAVATSLSAGKALGMGGPGLTLTQRVGQGAKLGALEGVAFGGGQGVGAMDRIKGALMYGAAGGTIGAAAPLAVAAIRGGANAASNPVMTALNIPSPTKAARAVQTYVNRSGLTPQQLDDALKAAAREGQPEFMLADALGNPGQRGLAGVARTPGDARRGIVDQLMRRQDGQAGRLARFVDEGLNDPQNVGKTAAQVQDGLVSARRTAADAAYDAARSGAGPVDVRDALAVIDARIGPMQGSGVRGDGIDGALAGFKARLAAPKSALPSGTTARELSDFDRVLGVKQDVEDAIGAALRAGRNNEARELGKLKAALDGALEASSDGYRAANDGFATASRAIDQIDAGSAATSPRVRAADTVQTYTGMPADQQSAFRAGYADPLLARIEKDAPGVNKARPLRSEKATAELGAMANDPALLGRRIERENTMFETGAQALGGSRTADNLADMAETEALSAPLIANVLSGRWGAAATQAGQGVLNAATGNSEATRALIAKALMGSDVQAALKPAQIAALKAGKASQVVEALMRAGALRAFGQ